MLRPDPKVLGGAAALVIGLAASIAVTFEGSPATSYLDRLPLTPTPTACQGHTGPDVEVGQVYSAAQCAAWFQADMLVANSTVRRCYPVDMPPSIEAAISDLAFNVGPGGKGVKDGVCELRSGAQPKIRQLAHQRRWSAVCEQFQYWAKAGGRVLAGLVRRRAAERDLCLRGVP